MMTMGIFTKLFGRKGGEKEPTRKRELSEGENNLLFLVNSLLHEYERDYRSQAYFVSIGALFEFCRKNGFKSIEDLLRNLKKKYTKEIKALGLKLETNQYIPFFEKTLVDRNPALQLHEDAMRKGESVAFMDIVGGNAYNNLLKIINYHGLTYDKVNRKVSFRPRQGRRNKMVTGKRSRGKGRKTLIKAIARERATAWWNLPERAEQLAWGYAICDECNNKIPVGEGYLIKFHRDGYTYLYCEKCMDQALRGKTTIRGTLSLDVVRLAGLEEGLD